MGKVALAAAFYVLSAVTSCILAFQCTILGCGSHCFLTGTFAAEDAAQTEIINLVSPSQDKVARTGLGELCTGDRQAHDACGAVFSL